MNKNNYCEENFCNKYFNNDIDLQNISNEGFSLIEEKCLFCEKEDIKIEKFINH